MTSRERLLCTLRGDIPDCVPVAPDISNMIPCRLTGKPFWDIYLYKNPPLWRAFLDAVHFFGQDVLMDGYVPVLFEGLDAVDRDWEERMILREPRRIVTQRCRKRANGLEWSEKVTLYPIAEPPWVVTPDKLRLPRVPARHAPVEGRAPEPDTVEALRAAKRLLGERGLLGIYCGTSSLIPDEGALYRYHDDRRPFLAERDRLLEYYARRFERIVALPEDARPDFVATGASGTLIFQTVDMFRELALPIVQQTTRLAKRHGLFSHVHSCGPERALVKICCEETELTVIDPLETPPMGDCDLAQLKALYGGRIVLKGNLHTTDVLLRGTAGQVAQAARRALRDAMEGGRFILSTGDQVGRDTPFENIRAMIDVARTEGRYKSPRA